MLKITDKIIKKQENFWNNCLFHPTDAIEDPWGKRLIEQFHSDGAIKTIRIWTMFEDIAYMDNAGNLQYDFRLNDLRIDYLTQLGFDLVLAYGMIPECIASDKTATASVAKGKTRYKGKLINSSLPTDFKLWEDICYQYTKHLVERYGEDRVSRWHLQCLNEPDNGSFFIPNRNDLPSREMTDIRIREYLRLYESFQKGVLRASKNLHIGGPVVSNSTIFLDGFLGGAREKELRLDFLALHNYGTSPSALNKGDSCITVDNNIRKQEQYIEIINRHGYTDTEILVDEWGASFCGFYNKEECPVFMFRETEVFSSYYVRLISEFIARDYNVSKMLLCLSGQHEMTEDFSGFRNFFTMNFIRKPIYNAFVLASKLHSGLLDYLCDNTNVSVIPTKNDNGDYAVLLTYCDNLHSESLEDISEIIDFGENAVGKKVTVYCIDKNTTNPYRLYEKLGVEVPDSECINRLRMEGELKPIDEFVYENETKVQLNLTANSTFLVIAESN